MVLVLKPINSNCGFALLRMTNGERVVVDEGQRKGWWEYEELFLWVVSAFFFFFFKQEDTATDVPTSLLCRERYSCPTTYCTSDPIWEATQGCPAGLRGWLYNYSTLGLSPAGDLLLHKCSHLSPLISSLISNSHHNNTGTMCQCVRIGIFITFLWRFCQDFSLFFLNDQLDPSSFCLYLDSRDRRDENMWKGDLADWNYWGTSHRTFLGKPLKPFNHQSADPAGSSVVYMGSGSVP